nr:MAG TPA: hypothetical protein [Caudoviricetes sp.]
MFLPYHLCDCCFSQSSILEKCEFYNIICEM